MVSYDTIINLKPLSYYLDVARQLLKDNGIECIPTEKSPMEDLMSNLPDLDVIPALER